MTDKIGIFELNIIREMSRSGNVVSLESYFSTEAEFRSWEEYCRKTPGNVSVHTLLGGRQVGVDITDGSVLTHYCTFDSDKLKDGWYMILSMDSRGEHMPSYFPFTVQLLFLGSTAQYMDGYSVYGLEEVTNDWSI